MPALELSDTKLHYTVEGSGPPVLFIQGVGVVGEGWRPQLDALRDRFQVCAYDNRGLGRSAPLAGKTSVEELARDARALLDALGWKSAHVVGHSLGGVIAQQLALDCPERVRSLSLLCTFVRGRDGARVTPKIAWIGMRMRIGSRAMRRRAFLEMLLPQAMRPQVDLDALAVQLADRFGRDLAEQPPIVMKQLSALGAHDASARLGALAPIPTLVVSAAEDLIAPPSQGRALAAAIGTARYVELDGAAHGVPLHSPERIDTLLAEHLARCEQGDRATA